MRGLAMVLAWLPAACFAGESCPWLNAATAAGVLGGAVKTTVTHRGQNPEDAACDFAREGAPVQELRIDVVTVGEARRAFASYAARCRTNAAPLGAIGNEAVACSAEGEKGRTAEQVTGRVRNRVFVVRVSTSDAKTERSAVRESARKVAEQVAGALF